MKKTIRINISGYIFNIDEDAYEKLKQYLNLITRQFIDSNEGNEIISDVESRIAELFQERNMDRKEVINLTDIEYVIEIMGKPEDFEETSKDEEAVNAEVQPKKGNRRIYRDPENKILSGLSAGIAAYYGIDPIIVRVLFVLLTLFYGTSILVYIILWIVIPEAKTRSQKLEMRGQDINLSNIQTSIKSEFKQVKNNINSWQNSKNYENLRSNASDALSLFWKTFGIVFKILLIVFGVCFLISGICILGAMTGMYFFDDTFLSPMTWTDQSYSIRNFLALFTDSYNANVLMISSYLLVLIPVLYLIYFGLKVIFRFKTKNKYIGLYAGSLWLVSLIVLIVASVKIAYSLKANEEVSQTYKIEEKSSDTLYLELSKNAQENEWDNHHARFNRQIIDFEKKEFKLFGDPSFAIEKSGTSQTEMLIIKKSNGMNDQDAVKYAKNIEYEWQQDDSVIYLQQYFYMKGEKKIRNQKVNVVLKVPVGKVVYIGQSLDLLCSHFENLNEYDCDEMPGHFWIMTENGLKLFGEEEHDSFNSENNSKENKNSEADTTKNNIKREIEDMKAELDSMRK